MLAYELTDGCRLAFLRRALDDPELEGVPDTEARCGRCDRCGGLKLSSETDETALAAARARLERPGVPVEPRRMWPTAMTQLGVDVRGRIPPAEQADTGRAVARLTDLGWGQHLRELFGPDAGDQEVPVPLRHALADVLAAWQHDEEFDGVVTIASMSRPVLAGHLAHGVARITGLPLLTRLALTETAAPSGRGAVNSAQRLAAVWGRFRIEDPAAVDARRVLLVDDRVVTGWTLAVCARALRASGATAVYPLVLATEN